MRISASALGRPRSVSQHHGARRHVRRDRRHGRPAAQPANAIALDTSTLIADPANRLLPLLEREPLLRDSLAEAHVRTAALDERARRGIRVHGGPRAARETTADSRVVARPRGSASGTSSCGSRRPSWRAFSASRAKSSINTSASGGATAGSSIRRAQIVIRNTEALRTVIAEGTKFNSALPAQHPTDAVPTAA